MKMSLMKSKEHASLMLKPRQWCNEWIFILFYFRYKGKQLSWIWQHGRILGGLWNFQFCQLKMSYVYHSPLFIKQKQNYLGIHRIYLTSIWQTPTVWLSY